MLSEPKFQFYKPGPGSLCHWQMLHGPGEALSRVTLESIAYCCGSSGAFLATIQSGIVSGNANVSVLGKAKARVRTTVPIAKSTRPCDQRALISPTTTNTAPKTRTAPTTYPVISVPSSGEGSCIAISQTPRAPSNTAATSATHRKGVNASEDTYGHRRKTMRATRPVSRTAAIGTIAVGNLTC